VFISDKRLQLGDFGISKVLEYTGDFAKTSLGTPFYLSPEICSGHKYEFKSDMWMLGCVLYEMCTFRRPFEGESLHVSLLFLIFRL
jgi:NIMA (never in mitosis gene a)-related kinase